MPISRRKLIAGSVLSGAAFGLAGGAKAFGPSPASSQLSFDWSDPADNLTGLVKLAGDLDEQPRWWSAQGMIYAVRPDHMTVPLVQVEGVRYLRFTRIEDGYRMTTRDWAVFRDRDTGAVISTFENPFTGLTNQVSHILLSRAVSWDMTPEKGQRMPSYTGEAWLIDRPLILPWVEEGDHVALTLPLLVKYANGVVGSEMEHFLGSARQLRDPSLSSVTLAKQAWVGNSPWLRWMEMGDIPGGTQWHSTGLKHESASQLRPEFREAIEQIWPGSLDAPETYVKPS